MTNPIPPRAASPESAFSVVDTASFLGQKSRNQLLFMGDTCKDELALYAAIPVFWGSLPVAGNIPVGV